MEWRLAHVGLVVKDIDKAVDQYQSTFGIGPFRKMELPVTEGELRGIPCKPILKLAFARMGAVQLELMQAEPGENIYWEFYQKHGEGLHHLGFDVGEEDSGPELDRLKNLGIGILQKGKTEGGTTFIYLDSSSIGGTILELILRQQPKV
jgi:methylmalonyl-CoA/ethylmalonyl-CoA epimerase